MFSLALSISTYSTYAYSSPNKPITKSQPHLTQQSSYNDLDPLSIKRLCADLQAPSSVHHKHNVVTFQAAALRSSFSLKRSRSSTPIGHHLFLLLRHSLTAKRQSPCRTLLTENTAPSVFSTRRSLARSFPGTKWTPSVS